MAEERIRRKLQLPDDERLAPSHYQTRRGTTIGRAPARQCLPLSGRMPQAIRPLCLSLSGHLPRELLMPPHATPTPVPPHPHHHHDPFPGAARLPGPYPHASTRGEGDTSGPRDDRGKELAGYLATVPRWRESRGPKPTPALESPEALSKSTPVDSPPKEAEGGQGRSQPPCGPTKLPGARLGRGEGAR